MCLRLRYHNHDETWLNHLVCLRLHHHNPETWLKDTVHSLTCIKAAISHIYPLQRFSTLCFNQERHFSIPQCHDLCTRKLNLSLISFCACKTHDLNLPYSFFQDRIYHHPQLVVFWELSNYFSLNHPSNICRQRREAKILSMLVMLSLHTLKLK